MAIRVAHIGTGNAGRIALNHLISDPRFELTGVWVSSDAKVGKDAGELAGTRRRSTGIAATNDLDALLATKPDCAVYCAMGDNRIPEAVTDVLRILSAGVNVVGTSPGVFQYPWGVMPDKYIAPIEEAAQQGNSSLFISGVDPGFANDLIPFAIASTCQKLEQVRCMEIADYATYDGSTVMFDVMGFGWTLDETPMLLQPGVLGMAWGTTIRHSSAGFGIEVDEIKDSCTRIPRRRRSTSRPDTSPRAARPRCGSRSSGMVKGKPVIVIDHVTRLREDLAPEWPQPAQPGGSYKVEIVGEPSYTVDICPTSRRGDHNYAAIAAGAGRVVNAIPAVVAAPPGIRTTLDLPLITGKGLFDAN